MMQRRIWHTARVIYEFVKAPLKLDETYKSYWATGSSVVRAGGSYTEAADFCSGPRFDSRSVTLCCVPTPPPLSLLWTVNKGYCNKKKKHPFKKETSYTYDNSAALRRVYSLDLWPIKKSWLYYEKENTQRKPWTHGLCKNKKKKCFAQACQNIYQRNTRNWMCKKYCTVDFVQIIGFT